MDKLLYLAKGASMCVFAGSLPRDVDTDIYAGLIRELRRLGVTTIVDTDGDPLRRAVRAEPDVISPNVLEAEELVGHEFTDDADDWAIAAREMCELGAREAIMTMGDGCFARMRPRDGEPSPRCTASSSPRPRWSRAPRSARATRSWPASSRRATPAAARPTASPTASPAAPSPRSTSARA